MSGSTASVLGRPVLPAVPDGDVPFWRVVLRGCSQLCFQCNEVTGALFLLAIATFSLDFLAFALIGAVTGPLIGILLGGDRVHLELGLYGFNSVLIGLAIGNFFELAPELWLAVLIAAAAAAVVNRVALHLLWFPVLAAPFIVVFWALWPFAEDVGLTKVEFPPWQDVPAAFIEGSIVALGAAVFSSTVAAGVIFLLGLLASSWRHAALAVSGALIANIMADWWNAPGGAVNLGFAGFNAVLAAVAVYAFAGEDIRLSLLGAVGSTMVLPPIIESGLQPLASGFVIITWVVLLLGWFQERYFDANPSAATGGGL